jgi:DNA-directed RNA polymerase specialized sigma24 family protein
LKLSDEELIKMLRQKDISAISILYDKYASAIYGAIFRDVQDVTISEEILQKCFLHIWNNPNFHTKYDSHVLLWMIIIAKRITMENRSAAALEDRH